MKNIEIALQLLIAGYSATAVVAAAQAAEPLPVPCAAGACGINGPSTWVTSGNATAVYQNNSLTITQTTQNAVLNWRSFNIAPDGTVEFKQPDATSVALNRIFQADPSRIFGSLKANGRIYLVNQNGIIFGERAKVNVGALLASTLNINADKVMASGLTGGGEATPIATRFDENGQEMVAGALQVEEGALLRADGGQIFLFAPVVENKGRIETPDGQTILAAGQSVYLSASTDQNLRGLIVAVDLEGTVENGDVSNAGVTDPSKLVGQIIAERGNVTLAGLTVNQRGRVSATTSVRANGSVQLIAATRNSGGSLTLTEGSRTEVRLDSDAESKTVDINDQPRSNVLLAGNRVVLEQDSSVVAPSGRIRIKASNEGSGAVRNPPAVGTDTTSRVFIDSGAVLDVSGVHTTQSMESNMLTVELRGSQLADSPAQRNGALRGQRVQIDTRQTGKREDGSTWVGSPIGDLAGDVATMSRTIEQRSLTGGTVAIESQGDVIVAQGATVNVSGGSVRYQDGYITPSALMGADGRVYDMADADPNLEYTGVVSGASYTRQDQRWGVTDRYHGTFAGSLGQFESGYIEGKDAGTLSILAPTAIFDGRLQADRTIGPRQRQQASTFTGSLYRPMDQIPLGGELLLGPAAGDNSPYVLGDVQVTTGLVLPSLRNANGSAFDPLSDALPSSLKATRVRPELFGEGAATRVEIRSDGRVSVPRETQLSMPAFSSLSITARDVDFDGSLSSAGGSVNLRANRTTTQQGFGQGEVRLGSSARLDLAGSWVNESQVLNPGQATEALSINGGSVSLRGVDSNVVVEQGSVIDVSGGARMQRGGRVNAGRGGSIAIAVQTSSIFADDAAALRLDGELRGYALAQGGSLSLAAAQVCIGVDSALCGAGLADDMFLIHPGRFQSGGFSSYSVSSTAGGLTVGRDTQVQLQAENFVLDDGAAGVASARSLADLTSIALLDSWQRGPVDLSLESSYLQATGTLLTAAEFANLPYLSVLAGARINTEPGARVQLESNTSIRVDGHITAPAGTISLALNSDLTVAEYLPTQSIWLGNNARLSAEGTTRYQPDARGLLIGEVLNGGSIVMDAARGYIAANPSSVLDVSGTSAPVDIRTVGRGGQESYERRQIASRAGSISVTAAESIVLGGELRAHSGDPKNVIGGTLSVTLDPTRRYGRFDLEPPPFPEMARRIELAATGASQVIRAGAALDAESSGRAVLVADQIEAAGFDNLELSAGTRQGSIGSLTPVPGEVAVRNGVDLSLRGRLAIDAASIVSDGGKANLAASVVTLGQRSSVLQDVPGTVASGPGSLTINAGLIDLVGHSTFSGFRHVELQSRGDIRARGVQLGSAREATGSLRTSGALTLQAQQVYPTTLSQFALIADEAEVGAIRVKPVSGTAAPVYSAGGRLSLTAQTIEQGGVLRAPFGTISLNAPSLSLLAGSTTATSAAGLSIPFGQTQGGFDWVYQLGNQTLVYNGKDATMPSQSVRLNGADVDIGDGAVVDVRGGGDLVAYEFVPGVGGTRDVLSADVRPDAFVIVPAANMPYAPYDISLYDGSGIRAGDSIYLDGTDKIPAGTYTILPARYAHLPGAYYVRPVDGYQDIGPTEVNVRPDGSTLVGGYRMFADTGLRIDGRSEGYAIRPGSDVMREAQYNLTNANKFFAANDAETALARLPRDAGTLSIGASEMLRLDGELLGSTATGGRGTALDISSDSLRIVHGTGATPVDGVVDIDADALSAFGAESILLGGSRTQTSEGLSITTLAREVEILEGSILTAPELLIVGTQSVAVREGAELRGSGTLAGVQSEEVALQGDGAILRVTSGADAAIERTNSAGGTALLNVESGAQLYARGGAIAAESAGAATFDGTLDLAGGVLSLTSDRISLGAVGENVSGLVLSNQQLAGLTLDALVLSSRSSIDLYGNVSLTSGDLSLRSGAVRGFGDGQAQLVATGTFTLEGASTASSEPAGDPAGSLNVRARDMVLGEGSTTVSGFSSVALQASGDIDAKDTGALIVDGDLSLSAARLGAASGASRDIQVSGAFRYSQNGTTPASEDESLGARMAVRAASIDVGGRVELHSGVLNLVATSGDVTLRETADLRLNGLTTLFDSVAVGSRGGWLTLESQRADVSVAQGAAINVAQASNVANERGAVTVRAASGNAIVAGTLTGAGADFTIDANQVVDFMALNRALTAGNFSGDRYVRQRGAGNLVVGADNSITARSIALVSDQGQVVVDGSLRSHDLGGGEIVLSGRNGVAVSGVLDVSAANASERNGRIELGTTQGTIRIAAPARIVGVANTGINHSVADGTLHIRAPRTAFETLLDGDATNNALVLAGDLTRLNGVTLEGYAAYTDLDGAITADEIAATPGTAMYDDALAFTSLSAQMVQGLGSVRAPTPQIMAGIEINSTGDLELQSDWSLNDWRFNSLPGFLTLRAAGDLTFNASLSDGFTTDSPGLLTETTQSWSYRLAAGADLTSADPMTVRSLSDLGEQGRGTLLVAPGTSTTRPTRMIRTGTGSIDIAAARNVELGNRGSVIYTAGIATQGVIYPGRGQNPVELGSRLYPDRGGDISISAGQDVVGASTNQFVTDWLWRVGAIGSTTSTVDTSRAPAWTVNFDRFMQNIGALGGGDVTVSAGRDVVDLHASAPSIGRQVGGLVLAANNLEVIAGGHVNVRAAHNISGGSAYSGRGSVSLTAGDAINVSTNSGLAPIIALGDAQAQLSSRTDLTLGNVLNPTLLGRGTSQTNTNAYFSTYTADSAVSARSTGGDVRLLNTSTEDLLQTFTTLNRSPGEEYVTALYPATVQAAALRGDALIERSFSLVPAIRGGLEMFGYGDVLFSSSVEVIISDADPQTLPTFNRPQPNTLSLIDVFKSSDSLSTTAKNVFHASVPERLRLPRTDFTPSRIVAREGDVVMLGGTSGIYSAESMRISAGRDVTGLRLDAQNLEARDVTSVSAGRDVIYPLRRNQFGGVERDISRIMLDGPGTLEIRAGRDLDLQASAGITTWGNLNNPALADSGADVSVEVGTAAKAPNLTAFADKYLRSAEFASQYPKSSQEYRNDLVTYMRRYGVTGGFDEALTAFVQLSASERAPLLERILMSELRASGRSAAQPGETNKDFSRGFAALTTYYPGANPDLDAKEVNPYVGDMRLYFSQIYTMDDGDIRLLAPGGEINAGLASPPAAFNLNKGAADLGIVAQRSGSVSALSFYDFLVNESRVFAADGGDILVWATQGDIDAGRGAKTAISAPPPQISFDPTTGAPVIVFPPALAGSGIQTLASTEGRKPGNVDLFAPRGVVNAGDAGIVAGNLTIAATAVLGADNIQVSGVSVGVPVDTGGIGASLAAVSSVGSSASSAATTAVEGERAQEEAPATLADTALSWLEVFVVGLGEEGCRQDDVECLKRQ
ncbi:filamentous hemagglutinin family protein [Povalibacter uvarum]|uniref:Filamentous hemagglutinin family protein n=1 Tax=Povalibacter uvarum TaxID=732238 RepID=A0A841HF83_9GAMM|nr:filamentous haemagglutinin family protein [Povalibacter uvarum]MBB6091234.1 filamentous hemagglutinin family protein [Povalibacter uvarum]